MIISLRAANSKDAETIAELINTSFEVERDYVKDPAETADSVRREMEIYPYWVAVTDQGTIIGCICVNPTLRGIFKLAVELPFRRKGYGHRLMTKAEEYCKAAGWTEVRIAILNFRTDLLEYYSNLGYAETGEQRSVAHAVQPCHLILMSKKPT
jgi:N-acetylglutamate synthase-like GNAT family acetyltransferase